MAKFKKLRSLQELSNRLGDFISVANANLAATGLNAADITALTNIKADADASIAAIIATRQAAKTATEAGQVSLTNGNNGFQQRVLVVFAKVGISDTLLTSLGYPPRPADTAPIPVFAPADLVVVGYDDGRNALRWKANGNKSGTTYHIRARQGNAGVFVLIDTSTKTKYNHLHQTPGVQMEYQVSAKRATGESGPSNVATVYAP